MISFPYRVSATEIVELKANIPVRLCSACGFEYTDYHADDARHSAVCQYLGVLTPSEVMAVRKAYGMTRAQFAHVTRIGEASLARWETGELIQNPANDNYLRLLRIPENMERLQGKNTVPLPPEVVHQDLKERFRSIRWIPHLEEQANAFRL